MYTSSRGIQYILPSNILQEVQIYPWLAAYCCYCCCCFCLVLLLSLLLHQLLAPVAGANTYGVADLYVLMSCKEDAKCLYSIKHEGSRSSIALSFSPIANLTSGFLLSLFHTCVCLLHQRTQRDDHSAIPS